MIIVAHCRRLCSLLFYCFSSVCFVFLMWNKKKKRRTGSSFNANIWSECMCIDEWSSSKLRKKKRNFLDIHVNQTWRYLYSGLIIETHNLKCHKWAKIVLYAWIIDLLSTRIKRHSKITSDSKIYARDGKKQRQSQQLKCTLIKKK